MQFIHIYKNGQGLLDIQYSGDGSAFNLSSMELDTISEKLMNLVNPDKGRNIQKCIYVSIFFFKFNTTFLGLTP